MAEPTMSEFMDFMKQMTKIFQRQETNMKQMREQINAKIDTSMTQLKTELTFQMKLKFDQCIMVLEPELKVNEKGQDELVSKVMEITNIAKINTEMGGIKIKETTCESKIELLDRELGIEVNPKLNSGKERDAKCEKEINRSIKNLSTNTDKPSTIRKIQPLKIQSLKVRNKSINMIGHYEYFSNLIKLIGS